MNLFIGIDLGGTKVAGVLVNERHVPAEKVRLIWNGAPLDEETIVASIRFSAVSSISNRMRVCPSDSSTTMKNASSLLP